MGIISLCKRVMRQGWPSTSITRHIAISTRNYVITQATQRLQKLFRITRFFPFRFFCLSFDAMAHLRSFRYRSVYNNDAHKEPNVARARKGGPDSPLSGHPAAQSGSRAEGIALQHLHIIGTQEGVGVGNGIPAHRTAHLFHGFVVALLHPRAHLL